MAGISQTRTISHVTPQRVILIMRYSPTLRHIPAPAVCTRTLAEGIRRVDLWRSAQPRHTSAALIMLLLISPTSEGWKAESALPPPVFVPGNTGLWIQRLNHCTVTVCYSWFLEGNQALEVGVRLRLRITIYIKLIIFESSCLMISVSKNIILFVLVKNIFA